MSSSNRISRLLGKGGKSHEELKITRIQKEEEAPQDGGNISPTSSTGNVANSSPSNAAGSTPSSGVSTPNPATPTNSSGSTIASIPTASVSTPIASQAKSSPRSLSSSVQNTSPPHSPRTSAPKKAPVRTLSLPEDDELKTPKSAELVPSTKTLTESSAANINGSESPNLEDDRKDKKKQKGRSIALGKGKKQEGATEKKKEEADNSTSANQPGSIGKKQGGRFGIFKSSKRKDESVGTVNNAVTASPPPLTGPQSLQGGGSTSVGSASTGSQISEISPSSAANSDKIEITRIGTKVHSLKDQKKEYCMITLNQIFRLLNIDDEDAIEITQKIEILADNAAKERDVFGVGTGIVMPSGEINLLRQIISKTNKLINAQERQQAVLLIQRSVRTYLLRKKLKALAENDRNKMKLFNKSFMELMQLESGYNVLFKSLVNNYLLPLRTKATSGKDIIKMEDITAIFSNAQDLKEINSQLLNKLNKLNEKWPIEGVGKILLDYAKEALKAYNVYVSNLQTAKDTVNRLKEEKKFHSLLVDIDKLIEKEKEKGEKDKESKDKQEKDKDKEKKEKENKETKEKQEKDKEKEKETKFADLLIEPSEHYEEIFGLVQTMAQNYVAGDDADKNLLHEAESLMAEGTKTLRTSLLQADESAVLMNLQRKLTGYEGPLNLVAENRILKKEGPLGKRYLFLCNDLIIITKTSNKRQYKLIEMCDPTKSEVGALNEKEFFIKTEKDTYLLQVKNKRELDEWMTAIEPMTNAKSVFGVAVETLAERDKQLVPKVIEKLLTHIETKQGLETEGIFRISGHTLEVAELRNMFDTYPPEEINLKLYKIHAVAGALKLWLRSLPEPLMSFHVYDLLVGEYQDAPKNLNTLVSLLKTMKPATSATLMFIVKYLAKVVALQELNKMSASNLAIVFGPSLLRSRGETDDPTSLSVCNQTVQSLILNYDKIVEMLNQN